MRNRVGWGSGGRPARRLILGWRGAVRFILGGRDAVRFILGGRGAHLSVFGGRDARRSLFGGRDARRSLCGLAAGLCLAGWAAGLTGAEGPGQVAAAGAVTPAGAELDDFETVGEWRPLDGRPTPELARTSQGHTGGALRCTLPESSRPQLVGRPVDGGPAWDQAQGLSFWIRGDGSRSFVAVWLLDETFTQRHAALVALESQEWHQVRLRWEDFVPEIVTTDWFGAPGAAQRPSVMRALWVGRWFSLRPWTACAFELDDLRLEPRLDAPPVLPPAAPDLSHTVGKLRAHQPVTIVALGDSVTCGTGLEKPASQAYPAVLQALLRARFGYDQITVVNQGQENLETRQAIMLLPRVLGDRTPDLVLVHLGYNDFTAMEERRLAPGACRQIAARNWRELVTRLRARTGGRTEVLLAGTIPGADPARRQAGDFLSETASETASELKCAFAGGPRQAFQEALRSGRPEDLFCRLPDGRLDPSHPNAEGHKLFATALLAAFEGKGE